MVHFFGIFTPGEQKRSPANEAPHKTGFFGGLTEKTGLFGGSPDPAFGAVPMTRAEQEACYLNGKAPEPELSDSLFAQPR